MAESEKIAIESLAEEIGKRQPFESLRQEAYLNLWRTQAQLAGEFSRLYRAHGLTDSKYNAMRILQGEGAAMQIYQIAERMVTPGTDVTRLVERLADDGLVSRHPCDVDRRVVWIKLTRRGKATLKKIYPHVHALHEQQFATLTNQELTALNDLLFRARRR